MNWIRRMKEGHRNYDELDGSDWMVDRHGNAYRVVGQLNGYTDGFHGATPPIEQLVLEDINGEVIEIHPNNPNFRPAE